MKVFISYSWDNDEHKDWVRKFTDVLISNGVDTTLDQYDLVYGQDRFLFMESGVRDAECVLCICTPEYVNRANERTKGVGVETSLITPKFYENNSSKQFIPIIRKTDLGISKVPDYLTALIYVDFQNDSVFGTSMEELLRHLHLQPKRRKPALGPVPAFDTQSATLATSSVSPTLSVDAILELIYKSNQNDWNYSDEKGLYVYRPNPDITIQKQYEPDRSDREFHEDWSSKFPDPVAFRSIHEFFYRATPIGSEFLVAVDGYRMYIPLPKSAMELVITKRQHIFGQLINYFNPYGDRYNEYLRRAGISVV